MKHLNEQIIREYLNDQLSGQQIQEVAKHLDSCQNCCDALEVFIDEESPVSASFLQNKHSQGTTVANRLACPPQLQTSIGNRFLLMSELARGGMGVVYRGFDRKLKREVAIKVLKTNETQAKHRLYREAQILGQLQHPGIVPVYETGRLKDGRLFIAMKLIGGQTLQQFLSDDNAEPSGLNELLSIFGQVCKTIAYAHSRNFVHRDLKPGNVMVGSFGEVQVMDWGLAKSLNSSSLKDPQFDGPSPGFSDAESEIASHNQSGAPTQDQVDTTRIQNETVENNFSAGTHDQPNSVPPSPLATQPGDIFGTPAYMPPEQAKGEAVDLRTDVFSLGGILLFLLTGQAPFEAPTKTLALSKSRENDLTASLLILKQKNYDDELIAIVESCLAKNTEDRPQDANQVNGRFNDYLAVREQKFEENRLESARSAERLVAQKRRNKQLKLFSVAIIIALLATAIAGCLYLFEKNNRIVEKNRIENETLMRQHKTESQIRSSISNAQRFRELASDSDSSVQPEYWQAALFETRQAQLLSGENISESLRSELDAIRTKLEKESENFFSIQRRLEEELECRDTVRQIVYECLYPYELRMAMFGRLSDKFKYAYEKIGIRYGDLSEPTVSRLAESEYNAFLMHGLFYWYYELKRETKRLGARSDDELTRVWLNDLIFEAERDPFRKKIREANADQDYCELTALIQQDEALDSLGRVLLCTPLVSRVQDPKISLDFLLRAQQAYPDEFQIRWKLSAVNGLDAETKKAFGLQSALACYALQPNNPAVLMNLGANYIQHEKYERAVELLEEVVELAPGFLDAQYNLANAYWRSGDHEPALEACDLIIQHQPDRSGAIMLRAFVLKDQGEIDKAIKDFQVAAKLNPNQDANYFLYQIYKDRNELEKAAKCLKESLDLKPQAHSHRNKLARLYVQLQQWDLAQKSFEYLLDANSGDVSAVASLANLHLVNKRPDESETTLRRAIFRGVNSQLIQLELAKSLLAQNDQNEDPEKLAEALLILEKLNENAPKLKEAKTLLKKHNK